MSDDTKPPASAWRAPAGLPTYRKRVVLYHPNGQQFEIKHGKVVIPSKGASTMQCGKCASLNFIAHVSPGISGAVVVKALVCVNCSKVFRIDDRSQVQGTARQLKANGHAQREAINQNPEKNSP